MRKDGWRNAAFLRLNYGQCSKMPQSWYVPTIQRVGLSILAMQDNLGVWWSSQIQTAKF